MAPDDDLNTPLGVGKSKPRRKLTPFALPVVAGLLGLALAVFVGWTLLVSDPLGGEPMAAVNARLTTEAAADKKPPAESVPPKQTAAVESKPPPHYPAPVSGKPAEPAGGSEQVITIIDGKSGARQEVRIPAAGESAAVGGDTALIEITKNGAIPRIGPDGTRAAQAYARPFQAKPNSPQIVIVVTGLGISANITTEAMNKLPGPVTFAFGPYGADLERVAAKARGLGHELLLQVPMEPFDYPDNDPGPKTLISTLPEDQNLDRLQWAMSRFQDYVGVVNQMGARLSASEMAFSPIIREIGRRGLIYVDDGSSARSLAGQIAGGNSLAFVKANLTLDVVPAPAEIDRALSRLEAAARENGLAVGFASALPVSIERISLWAKTAESRGLTLAPITAAAARSKAS
jgi:uncharacterized protein